MKKLFALVLLFISVKAFSQTPQKYYLKVGGVYTQGFDTTSLSNRINSKIDSLYKSGDSVYARKNGVFVFQYIDSSGGGGGAIFANNGLTKVVDTIKLGGALNQNTTIDGGSSTKYNTTITNGDLILSKGSWTGGQAGNLIFDNDRNIFWDNVFGNFISGNSSTGNMQYRATGSGKHIFNKSVEFDEYGQGFKTGSPTYSLGVTSTGTIIETPLPTPIDTTSLSNRINQKLNISDTASMLAPYFEAIDTVNLRRVTSVGLTMPSAFQVTNTPITTSGTINVTGAGTSSQYIKGDGSLANFPNITTSGGASINYYLNGSVNQGTFAGNTYYQLDRTPVIGPGTDFSLNADGIIARFITNAGNPALLNIPAGNFIFLNYFSASSAGGTPQFYINLYKYNGTTFSLISSNSANPETITSGTAIDLYYTALAVPQTTLTLTDRLAIEIYVIHDGRTITLHTEDSHLSEIQTTFSTGITALNGATESVQYFAVGTSGSDFNISSNTNTHTFNLPTASASNRGALSTSDWTNFNNKLNPSDTVSLSNRIDSKQDQLNGTGFVKASGTTITYDNTTYQPAITPGSISSTTTGVTIGNGPNSTVGPNVTVNIASASPTQAGLLSAANFNAFNNKQDTLILTTNGTTGQASFTPATNTLNIPQYGGSGGSGFGYTLILGFGVTPLTASTTFVSGSFYGSQALNTGLVNNRPSRWVLAPKVGTIVSASVICQLQTPGSLATPTSTTMTIRIANLSTIPITRTTITSTYPIGSNLDGGWIGGPGTSSNPPARNDFFNTFTPLAINAGDKIQIEILTPAWSTPPSDLTMNFVLFIE